MLTNLITVLQQKGISVHQYADFLEVNETTVRNKLNGITDFTYPELQKTCTLLLPGYNADFLFADICPGSLGINIPFQVNVCANITELMK